MSLVVDKSSPRFWKELKKESIVILKDEQAIEDSMEAGNGVNGTEYTISKINKIKEQNNYCEWIIFHLEEPDDDSIKLIVKIVDDIIDLKIYFEDYEEFEANSRAEIIEREDFWLFNEPENPDDFNILDLEFAKSIDWFRKYLLKPQGILFGEEKEKTFATIAEYQTNEKTSITDMFIIETEKCSEKGVFGKDGGYIQVWSGNSISDNDLEILPV